MSPVLTRRGLLLIGSGAALVGLGVAAAAWPLLALGFLEVSAVLCLYILFIPRAVLLRRKQLELAWWVRLGEATGGALVVDRPFALQILLRNHTRYRLLLAKMRILASSALEIEDQPAPALLGPHLEARIEARATARAAGRWFLHGMVLHLSDRFGVFALDLYYPNILGLKVFPFVGRGREAIPFRPRTGASHEKAGPRLVRQRGLGSDLREIREHIPGDPFKRIAWKATARTRRLMVREFESEITVTHYLLLDISSTMRGRRPGRSKLDYATGICAAFARAAIETGDRVGLITFDHRIVRHLAPSEGRPQLYRIVDHLMDLHSLVDEDLTDLTDSELYAAAAEYLAFQEGIGTAFRGRAPSRRDHPVWARLVEGPAGELYDAAAMREAVVGLLEKRRPGQPAPVLGPGGLSGASLPALLRQLCRACGLEIPYREHLSLEGKELGLAEALRIAGASRQSQFILLVSDLEEVTSRGSVIEALRLAKRRTHSIAVVAPFAPSFLAPPEDEHARRIHRIFSLRSERLSRPARDAISRIGVPILSAGPRDVLEWVLLRLARHRALRSGVAL
jgi:uncharacterized protein (DUF58 family)